MTQKKTKIIKHFQVLPGCYKIVLENAPIARACKPGQFVQVKVSDGYEPLLRRPFSIHRVDGKPLERLEILYEVVGEGSWLLSQKRVSETLDIIGPLGNGFAIRPPQNAILIAGGMGVAPISFLAEKLLEGKIKKAKVKSLLLLGARTKRHLLCEKELKALGYNVKIATDDGSKGFHGFVTELLQKELRIINHESTTIYACGPMPMLTEVSAIAQSRDIPAQISLEAHMACGIGACLGCVVKTVNGYKRVCKEGPVFEARDVRL